MGVTAATVVGSASAVIPRPRASVVIQVPVAQAHPAGYSVTHSEQYIGALVTHAIPLASVAYLEAVVSARVDESGRYQFKSDLFAVTDAPVLLTTKGLRDEVSPQSQQRYVLAKALTDTAFALDELSYAVSKQLADAYNVPDHLVHELTKRVFDAAGVTEDSVYALHKLLHDGVAMNDLFDVGDGSVYSFVKAVTNIVFANEQLTRGVSKKLQDSAAMLSTPMLHVEKAPFTDASSVSDTTDVVPELGKSDTANATDTQTLNVTKLVTDLFAVAEFVQSAIEKRLADTAGAEDSAAMGIDKPLSDAVGASSAKAYDLSKLLTGDSVGMTDSIEVVIVIIRDFFDSFGLTDSKTFALAKASQDSVGITEAQARAVSKALTDGVGMSDFTGIGDGLAFVLTRTVANVAFITDNSVRQSLLTKSELANVTDSGSLVNQDYCDLTYFAEDYVGVARSF